MEHCKFFIYWWLYDVWIPGRKTKELSSCNFDGVGDGRLVREEVLSVLEIVKFSLSLPEFKVIVMVG